MESEHVACVICNEETVKFTATTFNTSKSILKIWKEHNLKYSVQDAGRKLTGVIPFTNSLSACH